MFSKRADAGNFAVDSRWAMSTWLTLYYTIFVFVLLASVFLSGLMAIAMMVFTHRVKTTLRNLVVLVQGFFVFGLRPNPEISLDNPTLLKLPFGVAVATGTLLCFLATRWAV